MNWKKSLDLSLREHLYLEILFLRFLKDLERLDHDFWFRER